MSPNKTKNNHSSLRPCLKEIPGLKKNQAEILRRAEDLRIKGVKKGYLGGPMRGYENFNFPTFALAAEHLRSFGFKIFSPAEKDLAAGFDTEAEEEHPFIYYMRKDLPELMKTDAIFLLPRWEESVGAGLEMIVAMVCELPVIDALTLKFLSDEEISAFNCPNCDIALNVGHMVARQAAKVVGENHPHSAPGLKPLALLLQEAEEEQHPDK